MKSIKIIVSLTLALFFSSAGLYARDYNGKGLYLLGDGAAALGRGGTGVASSGLDFFYLNPASISSLERIGLSVQYGDLAGNFYNPDITLAVPTDWGNIGASFRYLGFPNGSAGMEKGYAFSLGLAKNIADKMMFGIAGNAFLGNEYDDDKLLFAGASLGLIYNFAGMNPKAGFGLFKPALGFSLTGGFPIGGANMNNFTAGYNFTFFRGNNFDLGFYNDISLLNFYKEFPVKAGFESHILKNIIARAGGIFINGYDFATFTAGAGYAFDAVLSDNSTFSGSFNYSLAYDNKSKLVHYIGLSAEYGVIDRQAPETRIEPDQKYISPNHDGVQDYVNFNLKVKDQSRIKKWSLRIVSPAGVLVKEFSLSDRDIVKSPSFAEFFKSIFSRKTSFDVPESIMWDGTDSKGETVADGKYTYIFTASDDRDNTSDEKSGSVIVDNTPPAADVSIEDFMFSPNGDGNKDSLIIKQNITSAPEDKWEAVFTNAEGKPVKKYTWNGSSVPSSIIWDGKDDNGSDVQEGLYRYHITGSDLAGNAASVEKNDIILTRQYQNVDIRLEKGYISYKKNPENRFYPSVSDQTGLVSYTISVMDSQRKPVYEIKGESGLPKSVSWNGLGSDGKELKDGLYYVRLETVFNSGNRPASFDHRLVIDSTPPDLQIRHEPELFSPDGDNESDVLTIKPKAADEFGIKEWVIEIKNPSGIIFKTFTGTGEPPAEIKWDGVGDSKDIVESAVEYDMTLSAVDRVGNSSKTGIDKISIDILVIVTERGLKMRISNIQFAFDSDKLQKQGMQILDRVYTILEKYARYDVVVEGHTDDIGQEKYNQSLSERRAAAVMEYLVSKGIRRERLKSTGYGKSVPLYPNNSEENRRRNRRVEFLLLKHE